MKNEYIDSQMDFLQHETKTMIRVFSQRPLSGAEFGQVIAKVFAGQLTKTQVASETVNGVRYNCFVVQLEPNWKETD